MTLITLRRHLNDAVALQGHCLLLSGEAGSGKSRLLATLVREALTRNMLVASGTAFAMESGIPYGALSDALPAPRRSLDAATVADTLGNTARLALAHQVAAQLYAWTGPASVAREHGMRALSLAAAGT